MARSNRASLNEKAAGTSRSSWRPFFKFAGIGVQRGVGPLNADAIYFPLPDEALIFISFFSSSAAFCLTGLM